MNIRREIIEAEGFGIPCAILEPSISHGAAVVVHGYGGCKEEHRCANRKLIRERG